jgi:lipopolysaccharide transport system ATP-binding protein
MNQSECSGLNSSEVVLRLRNVSHSFSARKDNFASGEHHVLQDVSFDVYKGEVLGIVGRNGVGKTTLLRLMAGILSPKSGSIEIEQGYTCALLSLGLGFQPHLSGRDNAFLAAILQGSSMVQAQEAMAEIAEFSELAASFYEPVKTYSAGMRARLGFATSLFTHVDVLLVDEVLAVGDREFRVKAEKAMIDKMSGQQTVIFVSHAEEQLKKVCSRAILLNAGSIVCEGTAEEVLSKYKTLF